MCASSIWILPVFSNAFRYTCRLLHTYIIVVFQCYPHIFIVFVFRLAFFTIWSFSSFHFHCHLWLLPFRNCFFCLRYMYIYTYLVVFYICTYIILLFCYAIRLRIISYCLKKVSVSAYKLRTIHNSTLLSQLPRRRPLIEL